jgi:hypothetical protein
VSSQRHQRYLRHPLRPAAPTAERHGCVVAVVPTTVKTQRRCSSRLLCADNSKKTAGLATRLKAALAAAVTPRSPGPTAGKLSILTSPAVGIPRLRQPGRKHPHPHRPGRGYSRIPDCRHPHSTGGAEGTPASRQARLQAPASPPAGPRLLPHPGLEAPASPPAGPRVLSHRARPDCRQAQHPCQLGGGHPVSSPARPWALRVFASPAAGTAYPRRPGRSTRHPASSAEGTSCIARQRRPKAPPHPHQPRQ